MIRINLLPFRLTRKRKTIRRQVSIFLLTMILVIVGLTWYTLGIEQRIAEKQSEIERIDSEISVYKEKAARVEKIQKQFKILEEKLKLLNPFNLGGTNNCCCSKTCSPVSFPEKCGLKVSMRMRGLSR